MHPPIAPVPEIAVDFTNEELFISLEKMMGGYPPPANVITDVNPYNYAPSNLPGSFVRVEENKPPTEEILGTNPSLLPILANGSKDLDNRVLQHAVRSHNAGYMDEGPSNSHDVGASSSRLGPSREEKEGC
ncbi:hypothetical protein GH714_015000 [Hevea brasiliensis]|uniref:Uncharacterized protein n=1 Tax=Hevea brasiliensis TaxID=3981 RepID=A0A6A6NH91_HEVBR|nr:hypothetical protein GH714_015000 [Hevea brasiliensis]